MGVGTGPNYLWMTNNLIKLEKRCRYITALTLRYAACLGEVAAATMYLMAA